MAQFVCAKIQIWKTTRDERDSNAICTAGWNTLTVPQTKQSYTVCICLTPAIAYTLSFQELGSRRAHKAVSRVACYKCRLILKTISPEWLNKRRRRQICEILLGQMKSITQNHWMTTWFLLGHGVIWKSMWKLISHKASVKGTTSSVCFQNSFRRLAAYAGSRVHTAFY